MKDKFRYIPKKDRKKILLLSDDIRMHSGVATMSREIVMNTAHHFNWYQLGAALDHPEKGKIFDLNDDLNKRLNLTDADVKVEPCTGYGDQNKSSSCSRTTRCNFYIYRSKILDLVI
jgi:hypothetical protein